MGGSTEPYIGVFMMLELFYISETSGLGEDRIFLPYVIVFFCSFWNLMVFFYCNRDGLC